MKTGDATTPTTALLAAALLAGLALPVSADPPGNYSESYTFAVVSKLDFRNGIGVADPTDKNNPCTEVVLGLQGLQAASIYHESLRIVTNLNGPIVGLSNLAPPLTPVPATSWLAGSAGLPLIPCPIPGAGSGNLWLIWSGMNWHSGHDALNTDINLCTRQAQLNGCFPIVGSQTVYASACRWDTASFTADYADSKGKYASGLPHDPLRLKSDTIECDPHHTHDYTDTITEFDANYATQSFDTIKNEDVVHAGEGTAYIVVCWDIDYIDLDHLSLGTQTAQTHDWVLALDLADSPTALTAALMNHLGPFDSTVLPSPVGVGAPGTYALQGLYTQSPTSAGQNGFGPCPAGPQPDPEVKKTSPLI